VPLLLLAATTTSKANPLVQFLPLVLIVVAFYFVGVRPQRNRMKALREAQLSIDVGREVMTTAGLYATVTAVDDETVTLEIAPGVHARFARSAIVRTVDDDPMPSDLMDDADYGDTGPARDVETHPETHPEPHPENGQEG
jgi:preprotein translocase subunit YajC